MQTCYHCGLPALSGNSLHYDEKVFCCVGCKTVYRLLAENDLTSYYDIQASPGKSPLPVKNQYDYLDNPDIVGKLLEFDDGNTQAITLHIPHIHCSSCIWILENLHRLQPAVSSARVNFPERKLRVIYDASAFTLKGLAELLASIGYDPNISLQDYGAKKPSADTSLTVKLGVAFFSFGNIMLLSFPEYFEVSEFWLDKYRSFFRFLIFLIALPSFLYSASGYYSAAWKSLRSGVLSIEIPIALGIIVMFVRSAIDMWFNHGPGFFDSMAGLIFFMLLGKTFQSKTYAFLSFERDYKSYFPVAVTRLTETGEESVMVYQVQKGDRLLIRNAEIISADGILISGEASVDYSFVTGESVPVRKVSGDKIFAGGQQIGGNLEIEVLKPVSQSYLTSLWANDAFAKRGAERYRSFTTVVSQHFTPALLLIALAGFGYWYFFDFKTAFDVFTAVLIVACPCALALTAPFTLGNILRIFGQYKFYLKEARVTEALAAIDTIVFDKTGTLTSTSDAKIIFHGNPLAPRQAERLKNALRGSNHPLSRMLYAHLPSTVKLRPEYFEETAGQGIRANFGQSQLKIGSAAFTGGQSQPEHLRTCVHLSEDDVYLGYFSIENRYRPGIDALMDELVQQYTLIVLSGDNEGEAETLRKLMPENTRLVFNQKPDEKLEFIKNLQSQGRKVMMVGDGLNDAGALMQSDAGIAISENVNVFSPACDAILDASAFSKLPNFLHLAKNAMTIMKVSFALSLLYNVVGLSFALSGRLDPLVAAIIMPLSTINIVALVTVAGNLCARKLRDQKLETGVKSPGMTKVIFYGESAT